MVEIIVPDVTWEELRLIEHDCKGEIEKHKNAIKFWQNQLEGYDKIVLRNDEEEINQNKEVVHV
jgi:hypothetical protein